MKQYLQNLWQKLSLGKKIIIISSIVLIGLYFRAIYFPESFDKHEMESNEPKISISKAGSIEGRNLKIKNDENRIYFNCRIVINDEWTSGEQNLGEMGEIIFPYKDFVDNKGVKMPQDVEILQGIVYLDYLDETKAVSFSFH